jgi:hypothetical protein
MKHNQKELWGKVNDIQRRVLASIGTELTAELRYSPVYQAYIDFCNDAVMAYTDGLLTPGVIKLLHEYADKLIAFNQRAPV